jgi:hypothetical protein
MDHVREFPTLTFATLSTITPQLWFENHKQAA